MKRISLLVLAIGALSLGSCRKHDCLCTTDVYDGNGNYVTTTKEVHKVKGFTTLKAAIECEEDGSSITNTYCSLD